MGAAVHRLAYPGVAKNLLDDLKDRVRKAIGEDKDVVGTSLMERAFGKNGRLRLSNEDQEQIGAMQVYRGVVAFIRNVAGHNVTGSHSQDDTLQFVVIVDLLLAIVEVSLRRAVRGKGCDRVGGTSVPYRSS